MRYDDIRLLQRYALQQYDEAAAGMASVQIDLQRNQVTKSKAYRKLRSWFNSLTPAAKVKAREFLREQLAAGGNHDDKETGNVQDDRGHGTVGSGDQGAGDGREDRGRGEGGQGDPPAGSD